MARRFNRTTNRDLEQTIQKDIFKYNLKEPYQNRQESSFREHSGCHICAVPDTITHQSTLKHRFNFLLWEWKKYRRSLIKNRNGIEVTIMPQAGNNLKYIERKETGSHILLATPQQADLVNNRFTFHVEIKNTGGNSIFLLGFDLLYPHESYRLDDYLNLMRNENVLELQKGAVYSFKVHIEFADSCIGCFKMPIILHFLSKTLKNNPDFDMMRQVVVNISDDETDLIAQLSKVERVKAIFTNVKNIVPPIDLPRQTKFQIPQQHRAVLALGLNEDRATTSDEIIAIKKIKTTMKLDHIDRTNYDNFFHFVLWMDEIGEEVMVSQYNMGKITLTPVEKKCFELQVEGLAEKRPSLLRNDIVNIKEHGSIDTVYQGKIMKLFDTKIHIGCLNPRFYNMLIDNPAMEVDISFQPSRITYERMHLGVQFATHKPYLLNSLFPNEHRTSLLQQGSFKIINEEDVFNKEILDNPEQIQAVENILNATSGNYPYIVFGPPGTGKTITIVEAILQIKKKVVNCNILVCAPANAACNMLASKLIPCCKKNELIRVFASSTNPEDGIPNDLKEYCNCKDKKIVHMRGDQLQKYRIVITTLATSGRYLDTKNFSPQYVFIDEAAQAAEPEAAMAVALLSRNFQLVLAGDPKQLGPIVVSKAAKQYQLDLSLLERLMSNELYVNQDPNFITMLRLNFRAHPQVLYLANKIFYNDQLQTMSLKALNDPIASICIYSKLNLSNKKKSKKSVAAVEFYAVFATEKREQRNPSYYNPEEVAMVEKTVVALCKLTETKVEQDDIGIIAPYNSQVHRIKLRLKDRGLTDVEVGTTETFQGREKRIIIISTVRAQKSLLHYDAKYKLGFIHSPQRFNVAVTRAMSKLIVIGCPNVLRYDPHCWLKYMDYCSSSNSYFGAPFDRRTETTMTEVISRFNQIKSGRR